MTGITVTRQVAAPIDTVFQIATDLKNAPGRIRGIKKLEVLTDGPVRKGTRFRETRVMFGREATEVMEIASFDPPNGYEVHVENHGCRYFSGFRFKPNAGGTEVEFHFNAEPISMFAKVMSVLLRPMMNSMLKLCAADLDDLKTAAEAHVTA